MTFPEKKEFYMVFCNLQLFSSKTKLQQEICQTVNLLIISVLIGFGDFEKLL